MALETISSLYEVQTIRPSRADFLQAKQVRPSGVMAFSQVGQTFLPKGFISLKHFSQIHWPSIEQETHLIGKIISNTQIFDRDKFFNNIDMWITPKKLFDLQKYVTIFVLIILP